MASMDIGMVVTFVNNAGAGLANLSNGIKKVGDNAQATHNRLKAIQVVIAGILLEKAIELGKAFVGIAAAVQSLDIRLAHFAGGAEPAAAVMRRLNKEFGATTFSVDKLGEDWIKLQSVMNNKELSSKTLDAIANSVAAMGGNDGTIEAVSTAFQKMAGSGTAALKEVKTLATSTGITTHDLAKAAGESFTVFDERLRAGLVTSKELIADFTKASQQKFGDFAAGLKNTVGGSFSQIKNDINEAVREIGARTNIFDRITLAFQNVDKAFNAWVKTIKQGDVDKLFNTLESFLPLALNIASGVLDLAGVLVNLGSIAARILSILPPEAWEFGLVGYMIGGKKLGILVGMLTYIGDNTGKAIANLIIYLGLAKEVKGYMDAAGKWIPNISGGPPTGFDTKTALDEIAASRAKLTAGSGTPPPVGDDDETARRAAAALAKRNYLDELGRAVEIVNGKLAVMNDEIGGDKLGAQLQAAQDKTLAWKDTVQKLIEKNDSLKVGFRATTEELANALQAIENIDVVTAREQIHIIEMNKLLREKLHLEQSIATELIKRNSLDVARAANQDPMYNAMSATAGGQLALAVDKQRFDLKQSIYNIGVLEKDIELQISQNLADHKGVTDLVAKRDEYQILLHTSEEALKSLSTAGEAGKLVWKEWGQAIETGVGDALLSVIDHTKTLGQIATQMYASITKAAANYIMKLAEIQMFGDVTTGGSGGSGHGGWMDKAFQSIGSWIGMGDKGGSAATGVTPTFAMNEFAKGGAFHGSVKAFANGDILSGPTMFGLAGEAGDEAIMPLKRGAGGKLGVAASGGGSVHIHINALDTQNAVEFIQKNAYHIGRALSHRSLLNREMR